MPPLLEKTGCSVREEGGFTMQKMRLGKRGPLGPLAEQIFDLQLGGADAESGRPQLRRIDGAAGDLS